MGWAAAFLFLSVAIMNGVEWRKVAFRRETLRWRGATEESESGQRLGSRLHTDPGDIIARYHPGPDEAIGEDFGRRGLGWGHRRRLGWTGTGIVP